MIKGRKNDGQLFKLTANEQTKGMEKMTNIVFGDNRLELITRDESAERVK